MFKLLGSTFITALFGVIALFFIAPVAQAGTMDKAIKYCRDYERDTGVGCSPQKCPCGRKTKKIKKWDRSGLKIGICACASKKDLKAAANATPEVQCRTNSDCSDGVFCNGQESCRAGQCVQGTGPCGKDGKCFEREKSCKAPCEDKDGDGYEAMHCGGDDCDDNNPKRSPGNKEVCDSKGIDEDCNARTVGDLDADGDGYISAQCK